MQVGQGLQDSSIQQDEKLICHVIFTMISISVCKEK